MSESCGGDRVCVWNIGDIAVVNSRSSSRKNYLGWVTRVPETIGSRKRVTLQFADGQKSSYQPKNLRLPRDPRSARTSVQTNPFYQVFCNEYIINQAKRNVNIIEETQPTEDTREDRQNKDSPTHESPIPDEIPSEIPLHSSRRYRTSARETTARDETQGILLEIVKELKLLNLRVCDMEDRIKNVEDDGSIMS